MFETPYIEAVSPFQTEEPIMDASSVSRSLFIIVLFFGLYLIIDLPYLWGGYENFLSAERVETLANYAKRGFYEILAVLFFSFLYIRVTDLVTKGQSLTKNGRIVFGALILELFLLLLSAFTRLDLYIAEYGWTEMRLLGMYYLILFLGGLAIMTIYRLKDWSWSRLERVGILWIYLWIVVISLLPNTAIATRQHIIWSQQTQTPIEFNWVQNPSPVQAAVYTRIIENGEFEDVLVDAKNVTPYTEGENLYPLSEMMSCVIQQRKKQATFPHPRYEQPWEELSTFNLNRERELAKKDFQAFELYKRDCKQYGLYY